MFGTCLARESAAPLILSLLLRKGHLPSPCTEVLLSSNEPHAVARVLAAAHRRASSKRSPQPVVQPSSKVRCAELLSDLPGFSPALPLSFAPQIVALSCNGAEARSGDGAGLITLPLSLAEVASRYRAQHRERQPFKTGPHISTPVALLEGARPRSLEGDSFDVHCRPGSKDLVVVDTAPGHAGAALLWETLLVAESALSERGSLVVITPHAFPQRIRRFLRWRFSTSYCAALDGGAHHYALCTGLATDFGTSSVRRDDFPGFSPATTRRPRKWNPYRRAEARKFVVSLRPAFTDAPHTKDALLRNEARDKKRDEELRDADGAFFSVAHAMVEKGAHYSQPND